MEISRRTDYAIRMLMALAASDGQPVSVRSLAQSQDVPYAFARTVQRELVGAGLVASRRGATGGITLERPAEEITLLEIVTATQGTPSVAICTADPDWCARSSTCTAHEVWHEADEMLRQFLGDKTLAGLIEEDRR